MPTTRERIADAIAGGTITESRGQLQTITEQYRGLYTETRKLAREVETLKEGGVLMEGYADGSWNDRLALDRHWQLVSGYMQHRVIQKSDVDVYADLLSYAYQFSPLIKGAIDIKTRYTFGLSFKVESEIENNQATIKEVMEDPRNRIAFFGSQAIAEADKALQKSGNIFIAIWVRPTPMQVRIWTSYEISDILSDPEDADIPQFYIRTWVDSAGTLQKRAYPSLFNVKYAGITDQDGTTVIVDNDIVVYHMTEGKSQKQKWALSPYTSALPWNRAFEGFLLDFAALVQIIRKYATMFTTKGGNAQVSALQEQFNHENHGHHAQQVGDQLISSEGNDFKVIDAGNNKIVGPADSRYFLLQVCTSTSVPENMLTGNPMTGNRASADELTANFLPVIEERQTAWTETFQAIFSKILGNTDFTVSFPPIRSQDALTYLQSLTQTATLGQAGKFAGVIRPEDVIRAAYEALDIEIPDDATVDEMVAAIMDQVNTDPAATASLNNLTQATNQMNTTIREMMEKRKAAKA